MTRLSTTIWLWARVGVDLLAASVALGAAFLVRLYWPIPFTESLLPSDRLILFLEAYALVLVSQNGILYFLGFYESHHPQATLERLRPLLAAALLQGLGLMAYYFLSDRPFPRSVLMLFVALNFMVLALLRRLFERNFGPPRRRAILLGSGKSALELAQEISKYPWYGVEVLGHIRTPDEADLPPGEGPGQLLGSLQDLPHLLRQGGVDEILLTGKSHTWQTHLIDELSSLNDVETSLLLFPDPFDSLVGRTRYRSIHDIPLVEVIPDVRWREGQWLKRVLDLTLASILLVPALPLIAACGLLIRATSPGPVFYRQIRVGRRQRPFVLWKLRTMQPDSESGKELLAQPSDPRLTRIGGVLRALRFDELPQLFNVLNGSMSVVGPRPERPGFVQRYLQEVPGYATRFAVRPGLSGLAQVNGDYYSSAENKLRYDLAYIANWNAWLDLSILVRTIRIILTSKGV